MHIYAMYEMIEMTTTLSIIMQEHCSAAALDFGTVRISATV